MGNEFDILMQMTLAGNAKGELKSLINSSMQLEKGMNAVLNVISKLDDETASAFSNEMKNIKKFEELKRVLMDVGKTLDSMSANKGLSKILKDSDAARLEGFVTQLRNARSELAELVLLGNKGKFDKLSNAGAIDAIAGRIKTSTEAIANITKSASAMNEAKKMLEKLHSISTKMGKTLNSGNALGADPTQMSRLDANMKQAIVYSNVLETMLRKKDANGVAGFIRTVTDATKKYVSVNKEAAVSVSEAKSRMREQKKEADALAKATQKAKKEIANLSGLQWKMYQSISNAKGAGVDAGAVNQLTRAYNKIASERTLLQGFVDTKNTSGIKDSIEKLGVLTAKGKAAKKTLDEITSDKNKAAAKSASVIKDAANVIDKLRAVGVKMGGTLRSSKGLGVDPTLMKRLENNMRQAFDYANRLESMSRNKNINGISGLMDTATAATKRYANVNREAAASVSEAQSKQKAQEKEINNLISATQKAETEIAKLNNLEKQMGQSINNAKAAGVDAQGTSALANILSKIAAEKALLQGSVGKMDTSGITTSISKLTLLSAEAKNTKRALDQLTSNKNKDASILAKYENNTLKKAISDAQKGIGRLIALRNNLFAVHSKGELLKMNTSEMKNAESAIKEITFYIGRLKTLSEAGDAKGISRMLEEIDNASKRAAQDMNALENSMRSQATQVRANAASYDGIITKMNELGKKSGWLSTLFSDTRMQFAMTFTSVYGIKSLLDNVIKVGGEFERQHVALQTILGDAREANELFSTLKQRALESPFTFKDLATYAKQLAAFSVPYEELYETTNRLSDMSAGLGVDMSRLILAYGQVRSATVLRGQELRQFTEAGVPMVQKLADYFTKLKGSVVDTKDIFKMISNKEVPFEAVRDVMYEMTDAGGEFYNMQERIADTVSGRLSNLHDAMQIFLGDLADSKGAFGSLLKGTIEGLTSIIRHTDLITSSFTGLVAAFGFKKFFSAANVMNVAGYSGKYKESTGKFDFGTGFNKAKTLEIEAAQQRIFALERKRLISGAQLTEQEIAQLNADRALLATKGSITQNEYIALALSGKLNKYQIASLAHHKVIEREQAVELMMAQGISKTEAERVLTLTRTQRNLESFGSKLGNAFSSIFNGANAAMLAITVIVGALMNAWQKAQGLKRMASDMTDALASSAESVRKFLNDNDVDITSDKISKAIEKYKEELKEASGNSYVITTELDAKFPKDTKEKLEAYRDILQQIADAKNRASNNSSVFVNANEDTDHWGADGGSLSDVIKSYREAKTEYDLNFTKKIGNNDYDGFIKKLKEVYLITTNDEKALIRMRKAGYTTSEMFRSLYQESGHFQYEVIQKKGNQTFGVTDDDIDVLNENSDKIKQKAKEYADTIRAYYGDALNSAEGKREVQAGIETWLSSIQDLDLNDKSNLKSVIYNALGLGETDELRKRLIDTFKSYNKALTAELQRTLKNGEDLTPDLEKRFRDAMKGAVHSVEQNMPFLKAALGNMFKDETIYKKLLVQFGFVSVELQDWQKELIEKFGKNEAITTVIKASTDPLDAVNKIRELYTATKKKIDELGPLEIKVGLALGPNKKSSSFVPGLDKLSKEANATMENLKKGSKALGIDLETSDKKNGGSKSGGGSKSSGGTKKDTELETAKKNFELYKRFIQEYEHWSDMVGREAAMKRLRSDNEFSSIFSLLTNPDDFVASVNKIMGKFNGSKNANRKDAWDSANAEMSKWLRKQEEENLKSSNTELKRNLDLLNEQYELYKKMLELTGDEEGSRAFSKIATGAVDTKGGLREKMQDVLGAGVTVDSIMAMSEKDFNEKYGKDSTLAVYREQLLKAQTDYQKKANSAILDGLKAHQLIDEQIEEENRKLKEQQDLINNSQGTPEQKKKALENAQYATGLKTSQLYYKRNIEDSGIASLIGNAGNLAKSTVDRIISFLEKERENGNYMTPEINKIYENLLKLQTEQQKKDLVGGFKSFFGDSGAIAKKGALLEYITGLNIKDPNQRVSISDGDAAKYGLKKGGQYSIGQLLSEANKEIVGFKNTLDNLKKGFDEIGNVLAPVVELFEALGEDMDVFKDALSIPSKAIGAASSVGGSLSSLGSLLQGSSATSGIGKALSAAGPYGAMAGAALSVATSIFALHDKALQKEIEASEQRQKEMENLSKNLETILERTFGGIYKAKATSLMTDNLRSVFGSHISASAISEMLGINVKSISDETAKAVKEALESEDYYDAAYASLRVQRDELQKQRDLEADKKKSDDSKISDYDQQLAELDEKIKYFAEDMAKSLYDIDVKSWAKEFTDVLVDAWANGEDAALAYKNKVTDIMNSLAKSIISKSIMEPIFEDVNNKVVELMKKNNGKLTEESIYEIADVMYEKSAVAESNVKAFADALKEKYGIDISDTSNNSTVGKGIQSVTEDTADLLASYINAIRADVSMNREYLSQIVEEGLTGVNASLVLQLTELKNLSAVAERNARATEEVRDMLNSVITVGSGGKKIRV